MEKISNNVFKDSKLGHFLNLMHSDGEMLTFNMYKSNGELVKSCITLPLGKLEDMLKTKYLEFVSLPI